MTRKSPIKDRPSYFRKTDEAVPELVDQQDSPTFNHLDSQMVGQSDIQAVRRRSKRTYYLSRETVDILDRIQFEEKVRTGEKPELSDLVDEAIRMFAESRQRKG